MPDPLWFGPPESVAALLETSNPATVVANIAAWLAEAIQHELSMGMSVANVAATLEQWIGLGGTAYGMKGSELNFAGLMPLAAHCMKHMAIGQAAVEANTVARSAVIPAIVCQTNRDETAALYASNICGCNTPAIAANEEMYYGQFTPQNMNAGLAYASVLNTLMGSIASTPPPVTPTGFSTAAAPAETVAQTAADSATQAPSALGDAAGEAASPASGMGDGLQSFMGAAQGLMSGATQPLQEMASGPTQALSSGAQSFTGLLQNFMGGFSGMGSQNAAAEAATASEALAGPLGGGAGGAAGSLGGGAGAVGAGYPGAGLTSFTRPASTFEPDGGRPTGLRPSGVLSAADLRGPTTGATGGGAMPMSPASAGMLGRENGGSDKDKARHARIVVERERQEV
jgi:PPE-repeat protein